jgi:heterotetrameric sarcosine oxidase delta subunit
MLRIECPWCGTRDEPEFTYGGESHIARPPPDCSDETWASYLFFRSNPKGRHAERWCHSFGCGQWFNVLRDTVTHRIIAVYRMGEPRPQVHNEPI